MTDCGIHTENGPCRRPKGHDVGWNSKGDRELRQQQSQAAADPKVEPDPTSR